MKTAALISLLRKRSAESTQARVARELGVTPAYLSDVLAGKRLPGPKMLRTLGLRREVVFQRVAADER